MPQLPTVTVNQEQADRCIAAYGSVAAYKQWLVREISAFVLEKERLHIKSVAAHEAKAQISSLSDPMSGAT